MNLIRPPREQRFYPAQSEPFAFEPLRSDFAVRVTGDNRGEGLMALRDFAIGTVVFAFRGEILPEMTQYTLQLEPGRHIDDPYVMGKALHHCAPNCHVDLANLTFIAIRPIAAGDYVTMDYCQTEDVLFRPFTCRCDAPACRGFINGKGLAAHAVIDAAAAEAKLRLAALARSSSRYENLARMAAICQELGNGLSRRIYAASTVGDRPLACKSGCSTCCAIPFTVPQVTTTDYTMTVLDVIALIEHSAGTDFTRVGQVRATGDDRVLPVTLCPHLTATGTCGIYDYRPVTCKIWFSANLTLCVRNREEGYEIGVNPLTDESDRVRTAFEAPFAACLEELAPGLAFRGHDFLSVFDMVAALARKGSMAAFRAAIDDGLPLAAACERALSR